ncbi:MAG: CRTAC1 family protein, partial [Flavobacteriales bacterium]
MSCKNRYQRAAIIAWLCFLSCAPIVAQFTDISSPLGISLTGNTLQSGCGVSMVDFDQDGWDDLTVGQPMNAILAYRNVNGSYQLTHVFDNTGDPKAIQWLDFDNDGDLDFFHSVMNQTARRYRRDSNDTFTEITDSLHWPLANARTFGCSWGDYDKDGFLDVYVCNYNVLPSGPTNWLLRNNGQGAFENVTAIAGVSNGMRRSYQSSWIDFNLDGWLDLFVANDMGDRNELFINNGGVSFTAIGADVGLNTAMEGMSTNFNDVDADGDWDLFVSNNLAGNAFFLNAGDTMNNIAASAGVLVNSTCWGTLWMDYDHDGLDDLHISTSNLAVNSNQNVLFHNNGDSTFSNVSMPNDLQIVFASAKGDQNNDGWWDFVEMKQYPAAVALWQNNGGENHWLKFGLEGTVSNRDGIGAIIRYDYPGKSGMLTTHNGEGYLDQDSQYEIISLADHVQLDSLSVEWPSGWVDRYYALESDHLYHFTEGETFQVQILNATGHGICSEFGQVMLTVAEEGSF